VLTVNLCQLFCVFYHRDAVVTALALNCDVSISVIEHELATVDSSPLSISPLLTPRDINVSQQNVSTLVTDHSSQALIADETLGAVNPDHVDVYLVPVFDNATTVAPPANDAVMFTVSDIGNTPVIGTVVQLQSPSSSTDTDLNDPNSDLLKSQSLTLSGGITSEELPGFDQVNDRP